MGVPSGGGVSNLFFFYSLKAKFYELNKIKGFIITFLFTTHDHVNFEIHVHFVWRGNYVEWIICSTESQRDWFRERLNDAIDISGVIVPI